MCVPWSNPLDVYSQTQSFTQHISILKAVRSLVFCISTTFNVVHALFSLIPTTPAASCLTSLALAPLLDIISARSQSEFPTWKSDQGSAPFTTIYRLPAMLTHSSLYPQVPLWAGRHNLLLQPLLPGPLTAPRSVRLSPPTRTLPSHSLPV